ncbi:MAG: ATP-dependent nuclease [Olsenella sp.]
MTAEEASDFLERNAEQASQGQSREPQFAPIGGGQPISRGNFTDCLNYPTGMLSASQFFVKRYQAGNLGAIVGQPLANRQGNTTASFGGILAPVYNDAALEHEISDVSEAAFGQPLTFDRLAFDLRFRVGRPDCKAPRLDEFSQEYVDAVTALPTLDEQGDGVRSFLGLVVSLLLGKQQIMLFDEPEAFLHPPQATALGRWVGKKSSELDKQVFLATHDRNILLGLLESKSEVTLLRLTREGNSNHLYQLDQEQAKATWTNPVLRYSNVLQGLFHRQAVICEADADCRFYNAVFDNVVERSGRHACADETLFIPAGGKSGVKPLAMALSSLHVKVFVILDFDSLDGKQNLKGIVEATGNEWTESMESCYGTFTNWTNGQASGTDGQPIKDRLKECGLNAVARGGPYQAAEQLISKLKTAGILIVPVGEMECLQKGITDKKGDAWVRLMLETGEYQSNQDAEELIEPIAAGLDATIHPAR